MISVQVSNRKQNQRFQHSGGPLEFGRGPRREVERFVLNDVYASRDQLRVEELPNRRLQIHNLSLKQEVILGDEQELSPGTHGQYSLPVRLKAGQTLMEFAWVPVDAFDRTSLLTIDAPADVSDASHPLPSLDTLGNTPAPGPLVRWFEAAVAVQRQATSEAEFYAQTARILVDMVGLDLGMVLFRRDWTWEVVARHTADPASSAEFSPALLSHVIAEGRTFYQDMTKASPSLRGFGVGLQGVDAVVVSPVFGLRDNMVGALYGLRNPRFPARGGRIVPLEAEMVQLLAASVGGHLGRAQEVRTRIAYEQTFAPRIIREIEREPSLLEGRNQEVTYLVSGLTDFSSIVEKLGAQSAFKLASAVLERLSDKVLQAGGSIVKYADAGLAALWNAPVRQHDHATLASGAALAFLAELPELSGRWQEELGTPLAVAFGLHTATATVGSLGCPQHFSYGATGPMVHVAEQACQAARKLRLPLLVTTATSEELPDRFAQRRLGRTRFAGVPEPVELYDLHGASAPPDWLNRRDAYESALALCEAGKWTEAQPLLTTLSEETYPADPAVLQLLERAAQAQTASTQPADALLDVS